MVLKMEFVAAAVLLLLCHACLQTCAVDVESGTETVGYSIKNRANVVPNGQIIVVFEAKPISTAGMVTAWTFWANVVASFRAIIFRGSGTSWNIVGITDISNADITSASQSVTKTIPVDERIQVRAGDVLGIALDSSSPHIEWNDENDGTNGGEAANVRFVSGIDPATLVVGGTVTTDMGPVLRAWSYQAVIARDLTNIASTPLTAWHLVFKAVSGVSQPDPYELWISNATLNEYEPKAQELTNEFRGHYQSRLVGIWDKLDILEVKVSLIKNGLVVKDIVFDGTESDSLNWFSTSRILSSPWTDLNSSSDPLIFSIEGLDRSDISTVRRFYIVRNHDGCPNDAGWLAMVTRHGVCDFDHPANITHPHFMYSNHTDASIWHSGPLTHADVFAIFIKLPLYMPGPSLMQSNSRFGANAESPSYQGLSRAQCSAHCKLDNSCSSFNHHVGSMTCELNTVAFSEGALAQHHGWNFYSINRNPGGKCAANPCQNDGFCQMSTNPLGYRCLCQPTHYGTDCQYHA